MERKVLGAYLDLSIQILANRAFEFNYSKIYMFLNSKINNPRPDPKFRRFLKLCQIDVIQTFTFENVRYD